MTLQPGESVRRDPTRGGRNDAPINIRISGTTEVNRMLANARRRYAPAMVNKILREELRKQNNRITPVETGFLRRSFRILGQGRGLVVRWNAPYARFVKRRGERAGQWALIIIDNAVQATIRRLTGEPLRRR